MVRLPVSDAEDALMVPVVSIFVLPVTRDAPSIVLPEIMGEVRVLLLSISDAVSVTTTPDDGYVAVELTPVPPAEVGSSPVTAAA
jgi:hypothetical protein